MTEESVIPSKRTSRSKNRWIDTCPSSLWQDAWRRLIRKPEAVFGLVVISLFLAIAIFAPWLAPYGLKDYHFELDNLPPFWVQKSLLGLRGDPRFLLGTDTLGRDLLSWGVYGARTSMLLGLISAPLIALFGTLVGLLAGYFGGRIDNWIMRITDVFYAFPPIMIYILIVLALRSTPSGKWLGGMFMMFVAFLSVGWVGAARMMRSTVLSVKNTEYIEAAHSIGAPPGRIIFRHILPNCLGPLLIWITLIIPQLILTEAVLGYLHISPGTGENASAFFLTSWGGMIMQGRPVVHVQPMVILIPAVCVGLISISFTYLGDALRDALDPQMRENRAID